MLALFETPAGFALFKVLNEGKLEAYEVRFLAPEFVLVFGNAVIIFLELRPFWALAGIVQGVRDGGYYPHLYFSICFFR